MGSLRLRRLTSAELDPAEVEAIRRILWDAFGDDREESFTELDWDHALGGIHVVGDIDGRIVAHASVVGRELQVAGRPIAMGYVEAVAVRPGEQRRGVGTAVMRDVAAIIDQGYEMGALGTGEHGFYERLGWRRWRGPSSVRTVSGDAPTPEDDGNILVLATAASPSLDLDAGISCDWRPGDAW